MMLSGTLSPQRAPSRKGINNDRQAMDRERLGRSLEAVPGRRKGLYEIGPNGAGAVRKAQYAKAWGENDEMGVLLDRQVRLI
jgi:hypothetical protein